MSTIESSLDVFGFSLTSNQELLKQKVLDNDFVKLIGKHATDLYYKWPYFFLEHDCRRPLIPVSLKRKPTVNYPLLR